MIKTENSTLHFALSERRLRPRAVPASPLANNIYYLLTCEYMINCALQLK